MISMNLCSNYLNEEERSNRTSLYEIFTPLWCLDSTTFSPSGVGGKYCAAEVPTSKKYATIHLETVVIFKEPMKKRENGDRSYLFICRSQT